MEIASSLMIYLNLWQPCWSLKATLAKRSAFNLTKSKVMGSSANNSFSKIFFNILSLLDFFSCLIVSWPSLKVLETLFFFCSKKYDSRAIFSLVAHHIWKILFKSRFLSMNFRYERFSYESSCQFPFLPLSKVGLRTFSKKARKLIPQQCWWHLISIPAEKDEAFTRNQNTT